MNIKKKLLWLFTTVLLIVCCTATGLAAENQANLEKNGTTYGSNEDYSEAIDYIVGKIQSNTTKIEVEQFKINASDFSELWDEVIYSNPAVYNISTKAKYTKRTYSNGNSYIGSITPNYLTGIDKAAFTKEYVKMMSVINDDMSDMEKVLAIHDYIVAQCTYDLQANPDDLSCTSFSMYGTVVKKKSVCQGYALTFLSAMKDLGIECNIVTGGNHAWNQVKINNKWYHIDCTWDDPQGSMNGSVSHTYFLKSDTFMASNIDGSYHVWNTNDFEKCTDKSFDGNKNVWDNTNNQMIYNNGVWYFSEHKSGTYYDYYYSFDMDTGIKKEIKKLGGIWYKSGNTGVYYPNTTRIATDGKCVYYTTQNSIRVMNFNGTSDTALMTISAGSAKIYGVSYVNNRLVYTLATGPASGTVTYSKAYTPAGFTVIKAAGNQGIVPKYSIGNSSLGSVASNSKITPKKRGTTTIVISTLATTKYPATYTKVGLKITSASLSAVTIKGVKAKTYTGKAIKQTITVYNGKYVVPSSSYTVSYSSNVKTGIAKLTIKAKSGGLYTGSKSASFKIAPKKVSLSSVTSKTKKKVIVKWKKVTGATGYRIYRATSKNGKYKLVTTVKNSKTVTKTISAKSNKKYYYKVVAYKSVNKTNIYGSYSKILSCKAK